MVNQILVARDFSPSSDRAMDYAMDLARRTGAEVHMMTVRVRQRDPLEAPKISDEPIDELQERFAERNLALLRERGYDVEQWQIRHHVERGDAAAPVLLDFATRKEMDVVVMGTRGQRGIRRMMAGSVAEEVVREAPCPVMTVRVNEEANPAQPDVQRILVPIDFSDPCRNAYRYAGNVAALYEVPVRLVHVVEEPSVPEVYDVTPAQIATREVQTRAERALEEWASELRDEGHEISTVVHRGDPEDAIPRAASRPDDLIVMATRGLSGLQRLVMGSVARGVVRSAPCPVITVRQSEERA